MNSLMKSDGFYFNSFFHVVLFHLLLFPMFVFFLYNFSFYYSRTSFRFHVTEVTV